MKPISFLIDTDWVIDHFNGVTQVTLRLKELQPRRVHREHREHGVERKGRPRGRPRDKSIY